MTARVLVHGATGFTGKLVCEALQRRGIEFAIAGRSREKLDALSRSLGTVETAVVDLGSPETIKTALEGRTIVCACAGPFIEVGEPMLASCARMGVHYVDTTGEQAFVLLAMKRYCATAEASGACVVPAMAYEIAPADWAADEAARRAGGSPDLVEVVYMVQPRAGIDSTITRGTKKSMIAMLTGGDAKQYVDGALADEGPATFVKGFTARSGRRVTAISFPSPEAVVVPSHTGARTVRTYMTIGRSTARALHVTRRIAPRAVRAVKPLLMRAIERSPEGPEGDARQMTFDVLAEAHKGASLTRVFLSGVDPYGLTAEIQALAAERALAGKLTARGVVAPSVAIPSEDAISALGPFGLTLSVPAV